MIKIRFKKIHGYKFDRWIFKTAMILIFVYLGFIIFLNGFDLDYFNCPMNSNSISASSRLMLPKDYKFKELNGQCRNPFYRETTWKNEEFLSPGEYGTKPGTLFELAKIVAFLIILLALLINHFIHNKDFKLKEAINEINNR